MQAIPRYTRRAHPWSNGKVEALNRTLKYQCFPLLLSMGDASFEEIDGGVCAWMRYYNHTRAHGGWINKGLPPHALWELWLSAKGTRLDKLVEIGAVTHHNIRYVRAMGVLPEESRSRDPELTGLDKT